jgi:hypothetical protein
VSTIDRDEWLSAGAVLSAADALRAGRRSFTPDQVAHLIAVAYDLGRAHGQDEALAQVFGSLKAALCGDADVPMREATAAHLRVVDAADARREADSRPLLHGGGPVPAW